MLNKRDFKEIDKNKREFIKKFGKYAATAPLSMYLLMGPGSSKAQASGSSAQYQPENEEVFDYDPTISDTGITTNPLNIYKPVTGKIKNWSE